MLLGALEAAVRLNDAYQEAYRTVRDRASGAPANGNAFDFDEAKLFGKFDLFAKRCKKLINMFTTVHQFSSLAAHTHIDGLEQMIKSFYNIVDDIKRKPYDLLDFSRNQFDRDFLEFNVNIHDLEMALQVGMNWLPVLATCIMLPLPWSSCTALEGVVMPSNPLTSTT